ncbi:MAG: hypothetical protein GXP35_03125 [Actinobacteria bacterium]|nr:hypothetical protein [Actinomycetota bacterium]
MNGEETPAAVGHLVECSHRLASDPHKTSYDDARYLSNVNRGGLWALSAVFHALGRNAPTLCHGITNQASGPGTENLLRESAAGVFVLGARGSFFTTGPRRAGCKLTGVMLALECRFLAGVSHAALRMQPAKANEVVMAPLPKHQDSIKEPNLDVPSRRHATWTRSADTRAGSCVPQGQSAVHQAWYPARQSPTHYLPGLERWPI